MRRNLVKVAFVGVGLVLLAGVGVWLYGPGEPRIAHQRPFKWDRYPVPRLRFTNEPIANVVKSVNDTVRSLSKGDVPRVVLLDTNAVQIVKFAPSAGIEEEMDAMILVFRKHEEEMKKRGADGFETGLYTGQIGGGHSLGCVLGELAMGAGLGYEKKEDGIHIRRDPCEFECRAYKISDRLVSLMEQMRKANDLHVDAEPKAHRRGVFNGRSLDGWDVGSSLQIGAAMRLLYYYPQQTTNLIAERLRRLDVSKYDMKREVTNGVRTGEFIKAVVWSKEPAIRAELQRIFRTTTDSEILRTTVVAMDPSNATESRRRLEELILNLPETEPGPFGEGYELMVTLGQQFGPEVRPAFERYMQNARMQRRRSMCRVLAKVRGDWSIDLLAPLLQDTRPAEGWTYAVVPGQNEPRLPIRICDEAAQTIAQNFPRLAFKMAGEHKDLDRQIEVIRDQIAHHDY